MSEALVPAAAEPAVVTRRGRGDRPAAGDRRRGAGCRRAVPGVLRGADREREDAGGVRAGGGAVSRVVRGARPRAPRRLARSTWPPTSGPTRVGPDRQAAPGRDPRALRLARRQPGPPGEPGGRGAGAEARRHQGRDAGPDPGRGEEAPRDDRHGHLAGLRDRALLSVMLYSFARVSAVLGMRRQDYFGQGSRGWLRLHEKGGKRHDVPAHHRAAAGLDAYVEAAGLEEPKAALFQSVDPAGRRLTGRALERRVVLAMIKRRASAAGLPPSTCCHTFRATGITAYLSNGGTLRARAADRGTCVAEDDEALRPDGGHGDGRRDRTHRDLTTAPAATGPSARHRRARRRRAVPRRCSRRPVGGAAGARESRVSMRHWGRRAARVRLRSAYVGDGGPEASRGQVPTDAAPGRRRDGVGLIWLATSGR